MATMLSTQPTGKTPISLKVDDGETSARRAAQTQQTAPRQASAKSAGSSWSDRGTLTRSSGEQGSAGSVAVHRVGESEPTRVALGKTPSLEEARKQTVSLAAALRKRDADSTDPMDGQLRRSLTQAGMMLLTEQFVVEVRKLVREQENCLNFMETNLDWALTQLYKGFCSIRSAATMLKQNNLATVAGRGEVLVCLLSQNIIKYQAIHLEMLEDTLHLMAGILNRIERDGNDQRCFSTARTALCLYAAAEPVTQGYQPSGRVRPSSLNA